MPRRGDLLRAIELPSTVRALSMTCLRATEYVAVAIGSGRDPDVIAALARRSYGKANATSSGGPPRALTTVTAMYCRPPAS